MDKCKVCGKEFETSPYYSYLHICSQECFCVNFWNETLDDEAIIIDGVCYHDAGDRPNERRTYLLGHAGRRFKIRMLNDGRIINTNNLWCQGSVPSERNIKDNAEFIKEKVDLKKNF